MIHRSLMLIVTLFIFTSCYDTAALKDLDWLQVQASSSDGSYTEAIDGTVDEILSPSAYSIVKLKGSDDFYYIAIPAKDIKVGDSIFYAPQDRVAVVTKLIKNQPSTIQVSDCDKKLAQKIENLLLKQQHSVQNSLDKLTKQVSQVSQVGGYAPRVVESSSVATQVDAQNAVKFYSVKEVLEQRKRLDGKRIMLKGKVTKIFNGFSNSSWVHLKDEGSREKDSRLVAIMASPEVNIGDVIYISAVVHIDQKLGFGLDFDVVLKRSRFVPDPNR